MHVRSLAPVALVLGVLTSLFAAAPARTVSADAMGGMPYVDSIFTVPSAPCAAVPTRLVVSGTFPSSCGAVAEQDPSRILFAVVDSAGCRACSRVVVEWADTLDLGSLAAGFHHVTITLAVIDPCSTAAETTFHRTGFDFFVSPECPEPPPLDPLRYLERIAIVAANSASHIICEDDSIRVLMGGTFPDDCHVLRNVQVLPSPLWSPIPLPPIVRLIFDNLCCLGRPCAAVPTAWAAAVTLPPLPGGRGYNLILQGAEVCCRDSVGPGDSVAVRLVPFAVVSPESCPVPSPLPCLLARWDHTRNTGQCDARFDPNGDARVTLELHTTVALAGLQGNVRATTVAGAAGLLHVTNVEPVGPAAGMRLTWKPTRAGAEFVLFAEHGAPIPSTLLIEPVPVVRFTFRQLPTATEFARDPNRSWIVRASDLLGSEIDGGGVRQCPVRATDDVATICVGGGACDLNGDALSDVRDLVLMVRCLSDGACPPDPATTLDCDDDHDFDIDDVLCCARVVLGGPGCPDCPTDSVRTETGVAVVFGDPVRGADGIDIPIRIDGVERIGAARLALQLPEGLAGAEVSGSNANWLVLDQHQGSSLALGLVGIGPVPAGRSVLDLVLHLNLPAGATAQGSVALGETQFSGQDGVLLAVDIGSPVVRLGPGVGMSLSSARPNPFEGSTSFRLALDATANVDLGIYDLVGRRVALLHHGRLALGVHTFAWSGRADDARRVPAGVYFVRASAGGASTVQKIVLVSGN